MKCIERDYPDGWHGNDKEALALFNYYEWKLSQRSFLQKILDWIAEK